MVDATTNPQPTTNSATVTQTRDLPVVVDRAAWQAEIDRLRVREKAQTREGDAIAAARRRLPIVEVDFDFVAGGDAGGLSVGVAEAEQVTAAHDRDPAPP